MNGNVLPIKTFIIVKRPECHYYDRSSANGYELLREGIPFYLSSDSLARIVPHIMFFLI